MSSPERMLLEEYVQSGKLMQLASLRQDGSPVICNLWYNVRFSPDVIYFISRHDREHSENIRHRVRVAGSIIAIALEGLGQTVRGVTFMGNARELPTTGIDAEIRSFVERWPAAAAAIDSEKLAVGKTPVRLYEISVTDWILFDELNFPDQPRRSIPADGAT